ncbi:hypothetical protein GCM10010331_79670 [Streptomyces xanthochromogenes]|uniref:terpene synthase family protein n=1 Tax=Streptomyces xanthochromogenes TaxID=67384 RepID=UPI00167B69FD|nr:terpene synthase family protein [Streptomyces xanthochromogenes]GHB80204.1 hypothetical protein GCM10010331_79670 [Streptomyces xanthochromogenes]
MPAASDCPGLLPGTRAYLPEVTHRFRWDFHPDFRAISARTEQWILEDLLPHDTARAREVLEVQSTMLCCTGFPDGDPDRLLDLCQVAAWWFAFDDDLDKLCRSAELTPRQQREACAAYVDDVFALMAGGAGDGTSGWSPRVIKNLVDRINAHGPDLVTRMAAALATWPSAATQAPDHSDVGDLDAYLAIRHPEAGCQSFMIYAQYVMDIHLTDDILAHPLVTEFQQAASHAWILPNDMHSFRRECFAGEHFNAVCLLRRHHGATLDEALAHLGRRLDEAQQRVLDIQLKIQHSDIAATPTLDPYLETLKTIGSANQRYSYYTPRYHGPGFRWNGVLSGQLTLFPDYTQFPGIILS